MSDYPREMLDKMQDVINEGMNKVQNHKKCNWCKGEQKTFWEHDPDGEGCFLHVQSKTSELLIYSPTQCSNFEMSVPINYCPMCGRKF